MNNKNVINKDTLIPIGVVIAIITTLFLFYSRYSLDYSKTEVQAAEIQNLKKDYQLHKGRSEEYFMSISKSLSRIEGRLDTIK